MRTPSNRLAIAMGLLKSSFMAFLALIALLYGMISGNLTWGFVRINVMIGLMVWVVSLLLGTYLATHFAFGYLAAILALYLLFSICCYYLAKKIYKEFIILQT